MKKAESSEITCQNCSSEAKAVSFCHTCSMFICASCTSHHKTMRAFASHEMIPISSLREGTRIQLPTKQTQTSTCEKHEGEHRKLYCFECEQLICRDCTLIDHAGHEFDFVKGVIDAFREEVLVSLVSLRDTHASVSTAIRRVEDSKKEIRDQGTDIATTITKSFKELRTILDEREQVLLQQAREVVGRKMDVLDRQQEDLQLALATLDSLVGFVERTAENVSDEEFISMKQQMTSQVQKVSRDHKDVKLSPNEGADMRVTVPPSTSLAELCKKYFIVDGPGLKTATTKQVSKFTVHTHDTHGQPPCVQQHVSAELKSLVDGSVLQTTVVSQTPSTFELSYIPTTRGRHQLTVRVNNIEIGTFQVFVQHPPTQLGTPVSVIEDINAWYIAVGDKGELFVTELHQYTVFDAQGQRVLTVGSEEEPPFEDGGTIGIATDGEGNMYITSDDHKLHKFNIHGEVVKSVGKKGENVGEFNWPFNVRCHNHQVYVCDSKNGRVQVFDSNLNFVRSFGNGPDQLKVPDDIDFDSQGNIYVVDYREDQVLVFSEDGQYLRHFGQWDEGEDELSGPAGLCVSGDYVYVTEYYNNRVTVFHTSGEFVHSFGEGGSDRGALDCPHGIAVDRDGFVFVCDTDNNCVQMF